MCIYLESEVDDGVWARGDVNDSPVICDMLASTHYFAVPGESLVQWAVRVAKALDASPLAKRLIKRSATQ